MRCTTGAGAGGGGGAVLVLEREMQPEPSVAAAKTSPIAKNFIMQVPQAKASLRMLPTVSRNADREKRFGAVSSAILSPCDQTAPVSQILTLANGLQP